MGDAPADNPLTEQQFVEALEQWVGEEVAVRVVSARDSLLAVFRDRLRGCSREKGAALFWPLGDGDAGAQAERPGVWLHPERFEQATAREGAFVLELRQDGVTLNLRRLDSRARAGPARAQAT